MSDSEGTASPNRPPWYTPSPALETFRAAVLDFVSAPVNGRDPADRGQDLKELRHLMDLQELTFAERAAAFAATEEAERQGSVSTMDWVRHETHMTSTAAARAIRVGEQVPSLPQSVAAVRSGEIGYAHLTLIASTSAAVTESKVAPPFDEQPLLAKAREHSVSRFRHDCDHARHAADAAGFLADHLTAVEWRSFEMSPCDNGVLLRGRLDSVGAATLRSALEPLASKAGAEDTRRRKRRLADALLELANHGLDAGVLPSQAGQRPASCSSPSRCRWPRCSAWRVIPASRGFCCARSRRSSMWAEPRECRHQRSGARWWRATVAASGLDVSARRHGRRRITSNIGGISE